MGFDAGSIIAHLRLDREEFQRELADAKAEGDKLGGETFEPTIAAEAQPFEEKVAEVEAEGEKLDATTYTVDVDADTSDVTKKVEALKSILSGHNGYFALAANDSRNLADNLKVVVREVGDLSKISWGGNNVLHQLLGGASPKHLSETMGRSATQTMVAIRRILSEELVKIKPELVGGKQLRFDIERRVREALTDSGFQKRTMAWGHPIGEAIDKGIAAGIKADTPKVEKAADNLHTRLVAVFEERFGGATFNKDGAKTSSGGGGPASLISTLFKGGGTRADVPGMLQSLGYKKSEITDIMEQVDRALAQEAEHTVSGGAHGAKGQDPLLAAVDQAIAKHDAKIKVPLKAAKGAESTLADDMARAMLPSEGAYQAALTRDVGKLINGGNTPLQRSMDAARARAWDSVKGNIHPPSGAAAVARENPLLHATSAQRKAFGEALKEAGVSSWTSAEAGKILERIMATDLKDGEQAFAGLGGGKGGGGGGILGRLKGILGGGGGSGGIGGWFKGLLGDGAASGEGATGLSSAGGSLLSNPYVLGIGGPVLSALLGPMALAGGGMIAGTTIGTAGLGMALIPGLADLTKGFTGASALSQGASTKTLTGSTTSGGLGLTRGQANLAKNMLPILHSLHRAETLVLPYLNRFIGAISRALPLFNRFGNTAVRALGGFFNQVSKGMSGKGFAAFMGEMSKLVGPIMGQFGKVVINLGKAFAPLLVAFGKLAASTIGPWFVRVTGDLARWAKHVHISHGMVHNMVGVLHSLAHILKPFVPLFVNLVRDLAPFGVLILKLAGWLANRLIPPTTHMLKTLHTLAERFMHLRIVKEVIKWMTPIVRVLGNVLTNSSNLSATWHRIWPAMSNVLLVFWHKFDNNVIHPLAHWFTHSLPHALHNVQRLWSRIWGDLKRDALGVWHHIHNDIFVPMHHFYEVVIVNSLNKVKRLWHQVWGAIQSKVQSVWKIVSPIFTSIKGALKDISHLLSSITSLPGKVGNIASKIGGGVAHGASSFWHDITGHASGGRPPVGQVSMVGERGPELFVPDVAGTIVPNSRLGSGSGGGRPPIIIHVDARQASDPQAVEHAAYAGLDTAMPAFEAALARGAA